MTTKIILSECPCCGHIMDRVSGFNTERAPSVGDNTICIGCGAICEFGRDMEMVLVPVELTQAPDFIDCRRLQRKVRMMRGLPV